MFCKRENILVSYLSNFIRTGMYRGVGWGGVGWGGVG